MPLIRTKATVWPMTAVACFSPLGLDESAACRVGTSPWLGHATTNLNHSPFAFPKNNPEPWLESYLHLFAFLRAQAFANAKEAFTQCVSLAQITLRANRVGDIGVPSAAVGSKPTGKGKRAKANHVRTCATHIYIYIYVCVCMYMLRSPPMNYLLGVFSMSQGQ